MHCGAFYDSNCLVRTTSYLLKVVISAPEGRLEAQPPVLIVLGLLGEDSQPGAEHQQPGDLQPHPGDGDWDCLSLLSPHCLSAFSQVRAGRLLLLY